MLTCNLFVYIWRIHQISYLNLGGMKLKVLQIQKSFNLNLRDKYTFKPI